MFKKILVPTDFSQHAENALKVAAILAKRYDAEIYLLHLLDLPMQLIDGANSGAASDLPEALFFMKLAHQRFETEMKKPFLKGVKVYETAEFNVAFDGIMDYANKYKTDLVIMGSTGATGNLLVGSNTEKVVRNAEIPVLIIKEERSSFRVRTFLYACNFENENKKAYRKAVAFASYIGIPIHIVYVNTPNKFKTTREINRLAKAFLDPEGFTNYKLAIYNDFNAQEGIMHYAEQIDADLIGIATHGRKGLAHFFNGSLSEGVVHKSKRPVVTFKIE